MDERDSQQKTKLPVWRTLGAAYATVFGRPGDLFALAAVPLAVSIAGGAFILFDPTGVIAGFAGTHGPGAAEGLRLSIDFLTTYLPWLVFVLAWYRLVLLGKRDRRGPVEPYLGARKESIFKDEGFLAGSVVGSLLAFLWIFLSLADFPPNFYETHMPLNFVTLVILALVGTPVLIEFPALVIGYETNIPGAWRQNSWSVWRFFWILLFAVLPFVVLFSLALLQDAAGAAASGFPDRDSATAGDLWAVIVRDLAMFLGTATFVTAQCLSYRHAVSGLDRPKQEATSPSDYMTGLVLPVVLGLVLGGATVPVANFLGLSADDRFLLGAIAFLIGFIGMGFVYACRRRRKTRAALAVRSG